MMSSGAVPLKTFRASRKRFRIGRKSFAFSPQPPFAFSPESFSRSPWNPVRVAPESPSKPEDARLLRMCRCHVFRNGDFFVANRMGSNRRTDCERIQQAPLKGSLLI
jgi:hypothetical protein